MANLTLAQLRALAVQAGFPGDVNASPITKGGMAAGSLADFAAAIAMAESSGDPNVIGPLPSHHNSDGSSDLGLWQINNKAHADILAGLGDRWREPATNAMLAHEVWLQAGQSFMPWNKYKDGGYEKYMNQKGADKGQVTSINPTDVLGKAVDKAAASLDWQGFVRSLLVPAGVFVLAIVLIILGVVMAAKNLTPMGAATHLVSQVRK